MYVIDLTHYLDAKGAIAPERGPARKMADFLTAAAISRPLPKASAIVIALEVFWAVSDA